MLEDESSHFDLPIKKVNNNIDAQMSLHQLFLCTSGISRILPKAEFEHYQTIAHKIFNFPEGLKGCIEEFKLTNVEKKLYSLITDFFNMYEQLIPVVYLENSKTFNNLDKQNYGVMTGNVSELLQFYANSYEIIFENMDLMIYLNNLFSRGDHTKFGGKQTYENFKKQIVKSRKLQYINENEFFSRHYTKLESLVRNSIQHYDYSVDHISQVITFYDGDKTPLEIYIIDFMNMCKENFVTIIYLFELVYNLMKAKACISGDVPTLYSQGIELSEQMDSKIVKTKKIGRNEKCPCGSGKKYKKCCI